MGPRVWAVHVIAVIRSGSRFDFPTLTELSSGDDAARAERIWLISSTTPIFTEWAGSPLGLFTGVELNDFEFGVIAQGFVMSDLLSFSLDEFFVRGVF